MSNGIENKEKGQEFFIPLSPAQAKLLHELQLNNDQQYNVIQALKQEQAQWAVDGSKEKKLLFKRFKTKEKEWQEKERELSSELRAYATLSEERRTLAILRASEGRLKAQLQDARETIEKLQSPTVEDSKLALQSQVEVNDALMIEVDELAKNLEEAQEQNRRLLTQALDREKSNSKLVAERIRNMQTHNLLREEKELLLKKIQIFEEKDKKREIMLDKLDERAKCLEEIAMKAREQGKIDDQTIETLRQTSREKSQMAIDFREKLDQHKKALAAMTKSLEDATRECSVSAKKNPIIKGKLFKLEKEM